MHAGGAYLGSRVSGVDVTAIAALPLGFLLLGEYGAFAHVLRQFAVTGFMVLFHRGDLAEGFRNGGETFPVRHFGKGGVHVRPLLVFSGGGGQQAFLRGFQGGRANGMRHFNAGVFQQFKEHFGVFLFIVSRFQENGRDLLVTGFFGHTGKVGVTVAGFGLPGKRLEEIFFLFLCL